MRGEERSGAGSIGIGTGGDRPRGRAAGGSLVASPLAALGLAALGLAAPGAAAAQPMTERPPNLEGTWTTTPHSLHFQFSHRFEVAGSDVDVSDLFGEGKVVNYPTFSLTYGLFEGAHLGVRYSSNSALVGQANEWQPYLKVAPVREALGGRLSISALGAWNAAAESFDGELSTRVDLGPLGLIAAARGYSSPFDRAAAEDDPELAFAGGAVLRLNRYLTLSGDYANMVTQPDAQVGWSAGVGLAIPYTPHTLAIFATNVTSGTLQGLSVGRDETVFWGFEFTIPFSSSRWGELFDPADRASPPSSGDGGPGAEADRPPPAPDRPAAAGETPPAAEEAATEPPPAAEPPAAAEQARAPASDRLVEVEISSLKFGPAEVRVAPGTTVRWVNRDPVPHTTTSVDGGWESPLLENGAAFERVFERPGRYDYYCMPHPFMKGAVVVTEGGGR